MSEQAFNEDEKLYNRTIDMLRKQWSDQQLAPFREVCLMDASSDIRKAEDIIRCIMQTIRERPHLLETMPEANVDDILFSIVIAGILQITTIMSGRRPDPDDLPDIDWRHA